MSSSANRRDPFAGISFASNRTCPELRRHPDTQAGQNKPHHGGERPHGTNPHVDEASISGPGTESQRPAGEGEI